MGTNRKPGMHDADNASMRMVYAADRMKAGRLTPRQAVEEIAKDYSLFLESLVGGYVASPKQMSRVTYALGIAVQGAVVALKRKGPVLVRWIDGEAMHELFFPKGPPPGMGG